MRPLHKIILLTVALSLGPLPAFSQSFDDGYEAYISGNYETALENFKPLAEQGDRYAQNNLGYMYLNGFGVPQDSWKAIQFFRQSAQQGYALAQYNLGYIYSNASTGIPNDHEESEKWHLQAAQQGHAEAQYSLGRMYAYAHNEGVPQDYTQAANWYRNAAQQGHAGAQFYLGYLYYNGEGVSHHPVMSYMLNELAAAQRHKYAISGRDRLADTLTQEQLAEARRIASEWQVGAPLPEFKDFRTWR